MLTRTAQVKITLHVIERMMGIPWTEYASYGEVLEKGQTKRILIVVS